MSALKKLLVGVLIVTTISMSLLVPVHRAQAIPVAEINVALIGHDIFQFIKDSIIDTIFWVIKEGIISGILDAVKSWVAGGFQGEPSFVQNPDRFFGDVANQASGVFIEEISDTLDIDSEFFCDVDIIPRFLLDVGTVPDSYRARLDCTLDDVLDNFDGQIEDFQRDFSRGGINAFLELQNPRNNRFGIYRLSVDELEERRRVADEQFRFAANAGGGYLPSVDCEDSDTSFGCKVYKIVVPSEAIADRVSAYVGSDVQRLVPADEILEVIATAVVVLVQKALLDFTR